MSEFDRETCPEASSSGGGIVDIVFSIPESISAQPIVISITQPKAIDLNEIHPSAATSNTSYDYSGRHDQGTLPMLKTEGHLANVIAAILEAKQQSDTILTKLIEEHQATTSVTGKSKSSVDIDDLEAVYGDEHAGGKKKAKKVRTDVK